MHPSTSGSGEAIVRPSGVLVALRASASWTAWGPYESVTPVVTTPKGSHGANYARERERERERREKRLCEEEK